MIEVQPTSGWAKIEDHYRFSHMYEPVCFCVLECVRSCERDIKKITLAIIKYVTKLICNCKFMSSVYIKVY